MSFESYEIWPPVQSELRSVVLAVPGLPSRSFWEGRKYEPVPGFAHWRERVEVGAAIPDTLGAAGQTREDATYLIDLYWPAEGSVFELKALADRIRRSFWSGREIASSGPAQIRGSVLGAELRRLVTGDVWLQLPVRVDFFIRYATRAA